MTKLIKNKLLKTLTLKADALDFQGNAVADGSLAVHDLSELSPIRAQEIYAQIAILVQKLQAEVKEAERLRKIDFHKEELERLTQKVERLKNGND